MQHNANGQMLHLEAWYLVQIPDSNHAGSIAKQAMLITGWMNTVMFCDAS